MNYQWQHKLKKTNTKYSSTLQTIRAESLFRDSITILPPIWIAPWGATARVQRRATTVWESAETIVRFGSSFFRNVLSCRIYQIFDPLCRLRMIIPSIIPPHNENNNNRKICAGLDRYLVVLIREFENFKNLKNWAHFKIKMLRKIG